MNTSLPSCEACVIDIPEVTGLSARFVYNFFTQDETTNANSVLQTTYVNDRRYLSTDSTVPQNVMSRVPRYIELDFSSLQIAAPGKSVRVPVGFIRDNVDKVMTEDQFATADYVSMRFFDTDVCNKALYIVSSSFVQRGIDESTSANRTQMLSKLQDVMPDVDSGYMSSAFDVQAAGNTTFFVSNAQSGAQSSRAADVSVAQRSLDGVHASANVQIKTKFFKHLVSTAMSTLSVHDDLTAAKALAATLRGASGDTFFSEDDYKTKITFVSKSQNNLTNKTTMQAVNIVGYIIDRAESTSTGDVLLPSMYVENPDLTRVRDYSVKYGTTYVYSVRAIAKVDLPALDESTGSMALLTTLVCSRPSKTVKIKTMEKLAPPPPENVSFVWDYERDKLLVHWCFPNNPQRDIKKFQVFSRNSLQKPFKLLREYDFNDATTPAKPNEKPDPSAVTVSDSPVTSFYDDSFTKSSKKIYAVCSGDAHSMSSCYSAQFEVSFDLFKNALVKSLVSHKGAPKQYPNLFLENSLFVDVIKASGKENTKIDVCFVPECYAVTDRQGRVLGEVQTDKTGGCYKLHVMNLDNQKSEIVTVNVSDRRSGFEVD